MDADIKQRELGEKASKVSQVYADSIKQINELGEKAISLLKSIRRKREGKKIEAINRELKG